MGAVCAVADRCISRGICVQISLSNIGLLAVVTVCYAGYNLFIKVSGNHVPAAATSALLGTICLQVAALFVSLLFLFLLLVKGGHSFQLTGKAYMWAVFAGICIGAAEIGYFYLFSGLGFDGGAEAATPMQANVVIPVVVSGTIVITMIFSIIALKESLGINQLLGSLLIVAGVVLFFVNNNNNAGVS